MAIIGAILCAVGVIASLILWIMSIVKAFKSNDTLWGVLNLLIVPICGIIWYFLKGSKKLGIYWIIAIVLYLVGAGIIGGSGAMTQLQP